MSGVPRIVGTGRAVPKTVRRNDDPIFDYLRSHQVPGQDLFLGFGERRCLAPDESLTDIMADAARAALDDAGASVDQVDILLGCGSISPTVVPNTLSEVHQRLGLDRRVWPIPLMNEFSQAPAAILMADALIRAGRCNTALLVFGDNWTRHVSYHTSQAISAGDGAAALVMRRSDDPARWLLVDQLCDADTGYFGAMVMSGAALDGPNAAQGLHDGRPVTHPHFQIDAQGIAGFKEFGQVRAPEAVLDLLARHGVAPGDACLISHQASSVLMDYWQARIAPGHYVETLDRYANMVSCSVPFNMSLWLDSGEVAQDWLVTLCLGPDMHASAALFRRGA